MEQYYHHIVVSNLLKDSPPFISNLFTYHHLSGNYFLVWYIIQSISQKSEFQQKSYNEELVVCLFFPQRYLLNQFISINLESLNYLNQFEDVLLVTNQDNTIRCIYKNGCLDRIQERAPDILC